MKNIIHRAVQDSTNLHQVRDSLLNLFQEIKNKKNNERIGYVAGIIFSEGLDRVKGNLQALSDHTEKIRQEKEFPIFSAIDVFYQGLFERLLEVKFPYDQRRAAFLQFWREIVGSGYVTDIFMTPRWELSEGARDEYETAKRTGVVIYYL